ncbi:hypothetical protein [Kibdelosporangium philippinense]|uniref:hypothetical protein n=1 Tax=Kibdelosporangium philippinense TaxID=211113 RepID=UPI00361ACD87
MTGARACLPLRHGVLNARAAHGGEQAGWWRVEQFDSPCRWGGHAVVHPSQPGWTSKAAEGAGPVGIAGP